MESVKESAVKQPVVETPLSKMPSFEEFRRDAKKSDAEVDYHDEKEIEMEKTRAFEALDDNFDIINEDKYGLVGVVGNVKQATEFLVYARDDEKEEKSDDIKTILDGLGLKYIEKTERSEYDSDYVEIQYCVAKTEEIVQRVVDLREACRKGVQTNEATRDLGRLFGFPETAIEYFIKRNNGVVPDEKYMPLKEYGFYIHSPGNEKEEYMQYEQKINGLFQKYCPTSARELLEHDKMDA